MTDVVLVTGASGQLGCEIRDCCNSIQNNKFVFCSKSELDITDPVQLEKIITENNVSVVVNCAAFTNVEYAEQAFNEAYMLNHLAVVGLSKLSFKYDFKVLHISTDYVFDGEKSVPYEEGCEARALNVYGKSKLLGEQALLDVNPKNIIFRTAWFYSEHGNNFFKTVMRLAEEKGVLKIVSDQVGTPTYARDLANLIVSLILHNKISSMSGIYHYSNEGVASWYDFAMAIVEIAKLDCTIKPISSDEYKVNARRPLYSVLDKSKIKNELNIEIPYWRDSLRELVDKLA